ncbi:AIPR family protein [Microvirga tunisiensis]|uniref:AIPR family protein n=1 Tax=Microvirga tunisiensis TaxID=2108360 RepID=A0A5N7MSI1_9HYPH|nr:AIPR family protein [Microvirga tunisiensis]MPR12025.1 AIPR family protein [Microvirga tunisiensis]MPR29961.1 AIPR family protein [Microvirga tunisiensis]
MHRVVRSHVDDFSKRFQIEGDISKRFEAFLNYSVLRSYSADAVNPSELVYEGDDPGIDGVLFFIDDVYVSSVDEIDELLKNRRRDCDVTIAFLQAKISENWDKKEINVFQSAIQDFLSESSSYPHSDYIRDRREMFDHILKNVGKLRGGKPQAHCYFATTAREPSEREILGAFKALQTEIDNTGLFTEAVIKPLDRNKLVDLWGQADGPVEASLPAFAIAAFPKAPGVEEGYVVTVKAQDFINRRLSDNNNKLRQRIFEENVRDFIGSDGGVNKEMAETISDDTKQKRFGILNNGVTIISPDVRIQGNELYLRDFQIVNGCQTSNVLFENRHLVTNDATLMLKVIETDEASLVDEIVRSTNRQTKVQDDQFLATLDCVKGIEKFFNARGVDENHRLYFERRQNQFLEHDIPAIRVFTISEIARCVGAMFLDKPDIASRYPNRLTGELRDTVFKRENIEDIYYTAAYASYRLQLYLSNGRIDPKYSKLRWHILMAIKYFVAGEKTPQTNSQKVRKICEEIDQFMSNSEEEGLERLRTLCTKISSVQDITRDKLKVQGFVQEIKQNALTARKASLKAAQSVS